jgi:GDP-D-mannose dehydratase
LSKTVLITGISGLIGLYCSRELLNKGYKVRGAIRNSSKQKEVINTLKKII